MTPMVKGQVNVKVKVFWSSFRTLAGTMFQILCTKRVHLQPQSKRKKRYNMENPTKVSGRVKLR